MLRVRVERKAQKKLSKIPEPYYSNLKIAILDLGNNLPKIITNLLETINIIKNKKHVSLSLN